MFSKILVPLDHSKHSNKALNVAIQMAKKFKGEITLIHTYSAYIPPFPHAHVPEPGGIPSHVPVVPTEYAEELSETNRKAGKRLLDDAKKKAETEQLKVDIKLVEGHAVEEIVKAAREKQSDLVVIGARGIGHFRELLLGSVTHGVMHHVSCPVLVVK